MSAPTGTTLPTYQQAYSYDSLDRITSGDKGTVSYGDTNHVHAATTLGSLPNPYASYDAMGNMTCRNIDTTSAYTCTSGSANGASMTYDSEGRMDSWTAPVAPRRVTSSSTTTRASASCSAPVPPAVVLPPSGRYHL